MRSVSEVVPGVFTVQSYVDQSMRFVRFTWFGPIAQAPQASSTACVPRLIIHSALYCASICLPRYANN